MDNERVNPYKRADGTPHLRRSVAAFLDLLGYRNYIQSSFKENSGEQELIRLRNALDRAYHDIKEHSNHSNEIGLQVRSFTDNLVIGCPIVDDRLARNYIQIVASYISFLQAELARHGYFLRGAIAVGDLYVDEDIVFGPALMEAYEAEQNYAVYPRVILCQSAESKFENTWSNQKIRDFLVDSDNRVFIDYLDSTVMIAFPDDRPFTEFLEDHKSSVIKKLALFKSEPYVRAKYEWAATYHNTFCDTYPDLFTGNNKIPDTVLTLAPKPWIIEQAPSAN